MGRLWNALVIISIFVIIILDSQEHIINQDWILKSFVLETFEFSSEHTAANIASELKRVATTHTSLNQKE